MNRTAAASLINSRVGRGRVDIDADILTELLLVQTTLEHEPTLPWFLLTTDITITGPLTGFGDFNLPDDFLRMPEEDEGALWVVDPSTGLYNQLDSQYSFVELQKTFSSEASGLPTNWSWGGLYGHVRPVPDLDYVFHMIYMAEDQDLSTDVENKWLKYAPEMIISKTVANLANYLADNELFDRASKDFQAAYARMIGENTARSEAGRDRVRGDPD